jgi:hypothetical protein
MKTRRSWWKPAIIAALAVTLALVGADALGLLRPHPSATQIAQRMASAWDRLTAYQADLSVGTTERGGAGPTSSRQWFDKREGLTLGTPDDLGFYHMERWNNTGWDYYQGGVDLLAHVTIRNATAVPYARWRLSRNPGLEDLVQAITSAGHWTFVQNATLDEGDAWIIECQPKTPAVDGATGTAASFYQDTFGRPWQVWISARTGLPAHILIGESSPGIPLRIGVQNLQVGPPSTKADWKRVGGQTGTVRQQMSLECDVQSQASIDATLRQIRTRVNTWKRTLLPKSAGAR